jgi:hypothetical protein
MHQSLFVILLLVVSLVKQTPDVVFILFEFVISIPEHSQASDVTNQKHGDKILQCSERDYSEYLPKLSSVRGNILII